MRPTPTRGMLGRSGRDISAHEAGHKEFAARLPAADAGQFSPLGRRGWLLGTGGVERSRAQHPRRIRAMRLPASHGLLPGSARVVARPGRDRSVITQKPRCFQVQPEGV